MKSDHAALAVSLIIYLTAAAGLYLMCEAYIRRTAARISLYKRLRPPKTERKRIIRLCDELVLAVTGRKNKGSVLLGGSAGLTAVSFAAAIRYMNGAYALCGSLMLGLMPFILLRTRLEHIRNKGSLEGETFVAELLGKYRVCRGNLDRALELLTEEKDKDTVCRKLVSRVLARMRETGRKENLRECGSSFAYAVNTNWADMLAYNMGLAAAENVDITSALEDILMQLREARSISEERKRLNSEAGKLVIFMVPFTYALTSFFSAKYLGLGLSGFLRNQFHTVEGVFFFFTIIFMFAANLLLLSLVRHRRFDY